MPDTDALLRIAYDTAEAGNLEHARRCYEARAALSNGMCLQALGYMYDVGEGVVADKALEPDRKLRWAISVGCDSPRVTKTTGIT